MRLVIIDTDLVWVERLRQGLTEEWQLVHVTTLDEAASVLAETPVQVFVGPLGLANLPGLSFISRVRSMRGHLRTPLVICAKEPGSVMAETCVIEGADDYHTKDDSLDVLMHKLHVSVARASRESSGHDHVVDAIIEYAKATDRAVAALSEGQQSIQASVQALARGRTRLTLERLKEPETRKAAAKDVVAAASAVSAAILALWGGLSAIVTELAKALP